MDMLLYSFEDADGKDFGTYTTTDVKEARCYAQRNRLRVREHRYEWCDSEVVNDYTDKHDEEEEGDEDDNAA